MAKVEKIVCDVCGKEAGFYKPSIYDEKENLKISFDLCEKHSNEFHKKNYKLYVEFQAKQTKFYEKFFGDALSLARAAAKTLKEEKEEKQKEAEKLKGGMGFGYCVLEPEKECNACGKCESLPANAVNLDEPA